MNSKFNLIILVLLTIIIFCVMTSNAVNAVDSNGNTNKVDNSKSKGNVKKPASKTADAVPNLDTSPIQEQPTVDKSTTTSKPTSTTTTTTDGPPTNTVKMKKVESTKKSNNKGKIVSNNLVNSQPQPQPQQYPNSLANSLLSSSNNNPAATAYLLLLDSKQLCLIVGNFQCVAQQNLFATSTFTTVFDSTNKVWSISGTVKDVSRNILQNITVTALLFDSKGNPVSNGPITVDVVPNALNSFEDGSFNLQADVKTMNVNPIYIVLNYQTTS
jgi:cytoskeletal protein RodZ